VAQSSGLASGAGWAPPPAADWVSRELGARLVVGHGAQYDQVGLALRLNPRRAHLLVSTVLGKYVPTHPGSACQAGTRLGRQVAGCLGEKHRCPVVVGYAETATALGHLVADVLGAPYLHSTRRALPGGLVSAAFTEPHSHAPEHRLLPARPDMLGGDGPLVLVDDELSTGTTAVNTIEAVHARYPRDRYIVASLLDVRCVADREAMATRVAALGARVEVVSLARGVVELPEDMVARSARLLATHTRPAPLPSSPPVPSSVPSPGPAPLSRLHPAWPPGLPEGGRHGFTPAHRSMLEAVVAEIAASIAPLVRGRRVLVLGCEEFMYLPLRVAEALQRCLAPGSEVRYASTARSPVLALDDATYPIRTRLAFPAHDRDAASGWRFAYNVAPGRDPARRFEDVVCVLDEAMHTPALGAAGGLLDVLRGVCDRVSVVVVPSYRPGRC
jgi:hypothetical protein